MRTEDRIKKVASEYGAALEVDEDIQAYIVQASGLDVWNDSGCGIIVERYGNECQTWKRDAAREIIERMKYGIR